LLRRKSIIGVVEGCGAFHGEKKWYGGKERRFLTLYKWCTKIIWYFPTSYPAKWGMHGATWFT